MTELQKELIQSVLEEIKETLINAENETCYSCGGSGVHVSFNVEMPDGTMIGGEEFAPFDNLMSAEDVSEDTLEDILNHYPDATGIYLGNFCSECLSCF